MSPRLAAGRRPWWIWAAPFALVLIVLVVRSSFLFTDRFYEDVDAGANSILIQQAMHFTLLVGNYALWFWWRGGPTWTAAWVPVVFYAVAIAAVGWLSRGAVRRFLAALLAVNVVSAVAFACYAAVGIDYLQEYYIGYFYFSAPIITLLVIAVAVVHARRRRWVPCWPPARRCSASPRSRWHRPRP